MSRKPEKTTYLGTSIKTYDGSNLTKENALLLLKRYYEDMRRKYTCQGQDVWIHFDEYQIIAKSYPPINIEPVMLVDGVSPPPEMIQSHTYAIKWKVRGRAFMIDRTFRKPRNNYRPHPNKKNVPKKKRGKPNAKSPTQIWIYRHGQG